MTEQSVFVPGLGFRSNRGLRLAEPATVSKDEGHALRIMSLLSTERGTEVAFELRDSDLQAACFSAPTDPRWTMGAEVRLRDATGAIVAELPPGRGQRFSVGQHEFGFLGRQVVFEPLPSDMRRVTVELRGGLGEWDVPVDLVPIDQSGVVPALQLTAEEERSGITVRARAVATTGTGTYLDIEAAASSPGGSVIGIRGWMRRGGDEERFALVDGRGRRFEEAFTRDVPRGSLREGGRRLVAFPPLPSDATELTLAVPAVIVTEVEGSLEIPLPVYAPTDASFGPYPLTIRWADVVDQLRTAPGEPPTRGIEVQFMSGEWRNERTLLWPGRILVDSVRNWNFGFDRADPAATHLNIRLREGESAKTVTFLEPVVKVRGPWEIRFRLSR